ncbi:MAG TPA: pilus assembly PilX N-terminal domain-containing protein, partial [Pyrinomonadaceae bacterium]|nr:pilus assembly PilX N-terminal domain-containing protein [Pyrinomonadaceae bacterium]
MNQKPLRKENDRWSNERGAALITSLLVSMLLLIVGGALILTTNIAQGLAIDSTAELQAYYAAEAGVNTTLNILRGNVDSNPAGTKATFRNVADNSTLTNWLTYDATVHGTSVVGVNSSPEMGFTVDVTDPDGTDPAKQPKRLLIHATGYGPKGSKKQMEIMVTRYIFDFSPNSVVLMIGADDGTTPITSFA